jgi:Tfp pilus assembly protein PilN
MKNINLLPVKYQKKPINRRLLLLIVVCSLSIWPVYNYCFLRYTSIRSEKASQRALLKQKTEQLPELEDNIVQQQADLEELENRVAEFLEMERRAPQYWLDVLAALVNSLPQNVIIQNFTCDSVSIQLSGTSTRDINSTKYLRNLKNSGLFSDVRLDKVIYRSNNEVSFQLSCTLDQIVEMENLMP